MEGSSYGENIRPVRARTRDIKPERERDYYGNKKILPAYPVSAEEASDFLALSGDRQPAELSMASIGHTHIQLLWTDLRH